MNPAAIPKLPIFPSSQMDIDVYSWGRPYYSARRAGANRLLWKLSVTLKDSGRPVQSVCEDGKLGGGPSGIISVDCLVYARDHHGCVSGIFSRRINRMAVPRTVGQPLWNEQPPFGIAQNAIEPGQIGIRAVLGGKD